MWQRLAACFTACNLTTLILACGSFAQDLNSPAIFRADELVVDEELGVVVASGNVEIFQAGRILLADSVTYNQRANTITASGNVSITEPTGEVVFGEYIELTDDLRQGIIRDIRVLLTDGSRIAARSAGRSNGDRTDMFKAVYSPCEICPDSRVKSPLWQIKAFRVVHDQRFKDIEYKDAFLEFYGVPIAYTPYFTHPDPSVKRRRGLLVPKYGSRSALGLTFETPLYLVLAPYRDLTIAPIFTTEEGVVMTAEFRERTTNGYFQFAGSGTRVNKRDDNGNEIDNTQTRGHIFGEGRFQLNPIWRAGFDLQRSTDDTYLERYGLSTEDTLTTSLFAEGFRDRAYLSAHSYLFQGLQEDDEQSDTPIIFPLLNLNSHGSPGARGFRMDINTNVLVLTRYGGLDSRRVSLGGTLERPYYTRGGAIATFTMAVRGDLYWISGQSRSDPRSGSSTDGVNGRVYPLAALNWRLPLVRPGQEVQQLIEPVATAIISPFGGNPNRIPNEDSSDVEFDDTNLFSLNRFSGYDRVEGGPRAIYGVRYGIFHPSGGYVSTFVGQSYRIRDDETFRDGSGLEDNLSDFVGRVDIVPSPFIDLNYRFRMDSSAITARRNEVDFRAGPKWLRLNLEYLRIMDTPADLNGVGEREEVSASATAQITPNWSLRAWGRRDLEEDLTINYGGTIGYVDECISLSLDAIRSFTRDRDAEPNTTFKFVIKLKNLG